MSRGFFDEHTRWATRAQGSVITSDYLRVQVEFDSDAANLSWLSNPHSGGGIGERQAQVINNGGALLNVVLSGIKP